MNEICATEKDIYLPQPATIQKMLLMNDTEMYFRFTMDEPAAPVFDFTPGQFVEVSVAGIGEAPITISSSPTQTDGIEMVIRRIGNVTKAVHKLKAGDKIGIRGPLGNGTYPVEQVKGQNLVFICGGIGLVPQRSFINYVLDNRDDYGEVTILLGTKCYSQRFLQSELEQWLARDDIHFMETIDEAHDCWNGNVGVVTTLIPKIQSDLSTSHVFVCGPPIMYKFVLMSLAEEKVPRDHIYLNLERKMKCGLGKCGHCQINHYYACIDGPVFRYSDLGVAPEAI
jgi:NAD(P)H-flavin reductase